MDKWIRAGAALAAVLTIAGCGGGGGGGSAATGGGNAAGGAVNQVIASAAASAANDTAVNTSAPFSVVQQAGVPAVTVANGTTKVNFTVFTGGQVKTDLKLANVSFAIAKLVPGSNGSIDQWVNYIYRKETATPTVGPNGHAVLASAMQATVDPKQTDAALAAAQLVYNPAGYYTYTFKTNIQDPTQTNGVAFEPARTHRVAIQLSYTDPAGNTVNVNPNFDFTLDGSGNSVPVTDPAQTRKMVDVASCNTCHQKLAVHGGGRVDTQFCVLCHNPGTTDANSGNVLTFMTMVHKIHAGKLLKQQLDLGKGGEEYTIWGYRDSKVDFADVGFPQDLGNCTVCHTGSNPATPQGDNWKTRPSREACLTCHASGPGSDWYNHHFVFSGNRDPNASVLTDADCAGCHTRNANISPERVHFNQIQADAAHYKMNIESAVYDPAARVVNVKYFLSDPTNGDTAYNLVTPDCTGTGATLACSSSTKFGNLRLYAAWESMPGQPLGVTEFTSYNNGGNTASVLAYKGANDGSNHYAAQIPVPADTPVSVVQGTGRVITVGQVKEPQLALEAATDPRPVASPLVLLSVPVQHASVDLAMTGPLAPRRQIVATEKCNVCHGFLGTASGSNTASNAFHGGGRTMVEACVVCHDPNRVSSSVMANGQPLNESFQFKRLIHGIHGASQRTYPFTEGNPVQGVFDMTGTLTTQGKFLADYKVTINGTSTVVIPAGTPVAAGATFDTIVNMIQAAATAKGYTGTIGEIENYGAIAYPQSPANCNACHVNDSYKVDRSPLAAAVSKPAGATDPMQWLVVSPKAASCTSCHDSPQAISHVTSFGNASFGTATQAQSLQTPETCNDCHAPGVFKGVDLVHGLQ